MAVALKVNHNDGSGFIDRTNQIVPDTLQKTEVLTKEPDNLQFDIRLYGTKTWFPSLNDVVQLYNGTGTLIFAGIVVQLDDIIEGLKITKTVTCKDYTEFLDRYLVAKEYDSMTGNAIIADILATVLPSSLGITGVNVVAPDSIDVIKFNYLTVSAALAKLAKALGNYQYFVDYNKDIHFFTNGSNLSPFNITDNSQNYDFHSMQVHYDTTQLRNHVFLRGGSMTGTSVTNNQVADGKQVVFFVGYELDSIAVAMALAATPTTFVSQTVGVDGVENPASFNCMYNLNSGLVIFPSPPAVGNVIQTSGTPIFPLLAEQSQISSISAYGEYQYLIIDKTIVSITSAMDRISRELSDYALPNFQIQFNTRVDGLRSGQVINYTSAMRGININCIIQQIQTTMNTPNGMIYAVQAISTNDLTLTDLLSKLLVNDVADDTSSDATDVIQAIYTDIETITTIDNFTVSLSHNPISETITTADTPVSQPPNYATVFVLGPYIPTIALNGSDTKRVFLLDRSSYLN